MTNMSFASYMLRASSKKHLEQMYLLNLGGILVQIQNSYFSYENNSYCYISYRINSDVPDKTFTMAEADTADNKKLKNHPAITGQVVFAPYFLVHWEEEVVVVAEIMQWRTKTNL